MLSTELTRIEFTDNRTPEAERVTQTADEFLAFASKNLIDSCLLEIGGFLSAREVANSLVSLDVNPREDFDDRASRLTIRGLHFFSSPR
jgi:hypothetical protein